jgi:peptide chain release factor 2
VLDLDALRTELAGLEEQAAQPDLWSDQERATQVTSRLSQVQAELRRVEDLRRRLEDAGVLHELAEAEDDPAPARRSRTELAGLQKAIGELEVRTLLGGEYDARDAL